jgi:hypothetical protein
MEHKVTEEDARLVLLQTELNGVQSSIRSLDTIMVQVKGWAITVSLAIGGFAVAQRKPGLLAVGVAAVAGFYIVTCQTKVVQRFFLTQNEKLNNELRNRGVMEILAGRGTMPIAGTTVLSFKAENESYFKMMIRNFKLFRREAAHPDTYTLYLFIVVCLAIEAIVLLS